MEKRYQVFVSSTYDDLRLERAEVMQALLELDCLPAGMELFPAASDDQWNWITRVIEESDYYLVIVGGRYGTTHPTRHLSYTELEYRHAVTVGKPVIAFLHAQPGEIATSKSEKSVESQRKLISFRKFCEERLCKYWTSPSDLGGKVSRSVAHLIKRVPAIGWVRGDSVDANFRLALLEAREELNNLRGRAHASSEGHPNIEFAGGDDPIVVSYYCDTQDSKLNKAGRRYWVAAEGIWGEATTTWNKIIKSIASALLSGETQNEIADRLNGACRQVALRDLTLPKGRDISQVRISSESLTAIKTQLIALGFIELERDSFQTIWRLTPAGRLAVLDLIAVKKRPKRASKVNKNRSSRRRPPS